MGTVSGTVLVDGEPTGGFEVVFVSPEGLEYTALAIKGGTYRVIGGRTSPDIPAGSYRVTVTPSSLVDDVPRPKMKLSEDYFDSARTPIIVEVNRGKNDIPLPLSSSK